VRARLKIAAVAALVLAAGFYRFFFFAKHDPVLAPLAPFGDDPYDASGSFCVIVSTLLALLSLVRAFRHHGGRAARIGQLYVARTQAAVAAGILVTLFVDSIALVRHPSQWLGRPGADELIALMGGLAAAAFGVLALARWAAGGEPAGGAISKMWPALATVLIAGIVLAVFPESAIRLLIWHFVAIVLGFVVVAWPQARIARAIVPCDEIVPVPFRRPWLPWLLIALFGTVIGISALAIEMSEGGGGSLTQQIEVAGMFLGAGMGTIMIGYAFLGRPLALFRRLAPLDAEPLQTVR
jgi:hypothetical protein